MVEGEIFGKYQLLRRIAFGGMAEIFLAVMRGDQGFAKTVVLKRIMEHYSQNQDFVQMFIDEAVIAAHLNHPNIVQTYDFGDVDGIYYIAMEFIDGIDLKRILTLSSEQQRKILPVEVAALGEGLCRGLSYAHAVCDERGSYIGLVHRDVSPHNIMISRAGNPMIMDFGIVKAKARLTSTVTGALKGKASYMAPEQAAGNDTDKRSDQFSVGVVLWECLTGEQKFQGDSELSILSRVVKGETRSARKVCEEIPEELDNIIMRALQLDPADRYPDLADMERELSSFRFSLGTSGEVHLDELVTELSPQTESVFAQQVQRTLSLGPEDEEVEENPPKVAEEILDATIPGEIFEESYPIQRSKRKVGRIAALLTLLTVSLFMVFQSIGKNEPPPIQAINKKPPVNEHTNINYKRNSDDKLDKKENPEKLPKQKLSTKVLGVENESRQKTKSIKPKTTPKQKQKSKTQPTPKPTRKTKQIVTKAKPKNKTSQVKQKKVTKEPEPVVEPVFGYLSMRSSGVWAEVYLSGKMLGITPLTRVKIPSGTHILQLVNPDLGLKKLIQITISPKKETRKTINLP